ncbi:hypothetical protein [Pyxidicoccus sp. MSG2]|uniref:hypothetical protein n=1 Tax=Pyxidicoccus sp. MSG2 TaxID=2996790 RepID=UPI002270DA58|nr:hypothetical protein [Pyxidicoccus sp. MSG2]MCY1022550.1 hypothetical protein [Pyxidicoccus sp. MSG2]
MVPNVGHDLRLGKMKRSLRIAQLAGVVLGLTGCATLSTSDMPAPCRSQDNACLGTCQPAGSAPRRFPESSPDNEPANTETDFDTLGCVNSCNEQANRCN